MGCVVVEHRITIACLSKKFFCDYPKDAYPELMDKPERPYACLLLKADNGYYICIPFRSHIRHNSAYFFKNTIRSKSSKSGLDYTKVVLVKNLQYLVIGRSIVDQDEYNEAVKNYHKIARDISSYINDYIEHQKGNCPLHSREFERRYRYSTIKYFHNILSLE